MSIKAEDFANNIGILSVEKNRGKKTFQGFFSTARLGGENHEREKMQALCLCLASDCGDAESLPAMQVVSVA